MLKRHQFVEVNNVVAITEFIVLLFIFHTETAKTDK